MFRFIVDKGHHVLSLKINYTVTAGNDSVTELFFCTPERYTESLERFFYYRSKINTINITTYFLPVFKLV